MLLIALMIGNAACRSSQSDPESFQWNPPEFRVKGTYYFQPKAAINNFWTSVNWEQTGKDFQQLRGDGFNTIILFIPWGIFQPSIKPVSYSETAFEELDHVFQLANSHGLKVALRVGTHDHIPRGATGGKWLIGTVLADDAEWQAYRDLFRELAVRTKNHSNLLFFFWTFEDTGYPPDLWFHQYPANVAAFRQWLRRRPLDEWNELWNEENTSYDTVEPPNQNLPPLNEIKLASFLEFSDELLARRLPDACAAAKQGNPNVLVSYQPRAEINFGHDFALQFQLPPCYSFITTWYSPYQSYLFGDMRRDLDGKTTASYVPKYLERTKKLARGLPVFVDQFNFQHFGGTAEEGGIRTAAEQLIFVADSLPVLLDESLGYALWNYSDYYLNVVNDGYFRFGFQEWETPAQPGRVVILPSEGSANPAAEIREGGFLRQNVRVYANQEYTLEFSAANAGADTQANFLIQFLPTDQKLEHSVPLNARFKPYSVKVKIPQNSDAIVLSISPQAGGPAISIKEILFYPWIDTGGIYDVDGKPRLELRDVFRKYNQSVP